MGAFLTTTRAAASSRAESPAWRSKMVRSFPFSGSIKAELDMFASSSVRTRF